MAGTSSIPFDLGSRENLSYFSTRLLHEVIRSQLSSFNADVSLNSTHDKICLGCMVATAGLMEGYGRLHFKFYIPVLSYIKILHFNESIKKPC